MDGPQSVPRAQCDLDSVVHRRIIDSSGAFIPPASYYGAKSQQPNHIFLLHFPLLVSLPFSFSPLLSPYNNGLVA